MDRHLPAQMAPLRRAVGIERYSTSPDAVRRAAVRAAFHLKRPRLGTPDYVLDALHREYQRQPSLRATAKRFGVTASHVAYLFKNYGYETRKKKLRPRLIHNGIIYTRDDRGYYRQTKRGTQGIALHRVIWEERRGPIPAGCRLIFLSPDKTDFSDANLRCVTGREARAHAGRAKLGVKQRNR